MSEPLVHIDAVDLAALADRLGTPLHVYSASLLRERIATLTNALTGFDALICYAAKANTNRAIVQMMAEAGLGADIVSEGELERCLRAGMPASRIVFSGVGKQAGEIDRALDAGIARFNVESHDELELLQQRAHARNTTARASVRVNPDVDALTHAKISTGKAENKFGVGIDEARRWFAHAGALDHVRLDGLHMHIGSQMLNLEPVRAALRRMAELWRELVAAGHDIACIDVGGGLGVPYREGHDRGIDPAAYAAAIGEYLGDFGGRIVVEPGRWLVAEAGVLLSRVIRVKQGEQRRFLVLDAAMTELLRPSLYDAWHDITAVGPDPRPPLAYDVVGPVCETGDTFAVDRPVAECRSGDLVAIRCTGAYGASMASTYNSRPLAAEVLVDQGRYAVIRQRQTLDAMLADERPAGDWATP